MTQLLQTHLMMLYQLHLMTHSLYNCGEIYKIAIDYCDRIELTRVHDNFEGDTVFPEIDEEKWIESNRIERRKMKSNYDFTFITYNKIKR